MSNYRKIEVKYPTYDYSCFKACSIIEGCRSNIRGYYDKNVRDQISACVLDYVAKVYAEGCRSFIFTAEPGFGNIAFNEVLRFKKARRRTRMTLKVYVPFNGFEILYPNDETFNRETFYSMLDEADAVHLYNKRVTIDDSHETIEKMRDDCIKALISDSKYLIVSHAEGKVQDWVQRTAMLHEIYEVPTDSYNA